MENSIIFIINCTKIFVCEWDSDETTILESKADLKIQNGTDYFYGHNLI